MRKINKTKIKLLFLFLLLPGDFFLAGLVYGIGGNSEFKKAHDAVTKDFNYPDAKLGSQIIELSPTPEIYEDETEEILTESEDYYEEIENPTPTPVSIGGTNQISLTPALTLSPTSSPSPTPTIINEISETPTPTQTSVAN